MAKYLRNPFVAIEANPDCTSLLRGNLSANSLKENALLRILQTGIGSEEGHKTFYLSNTNPGLNNFGSNQVRMHPDKSMQLKVTTIDSLGLSNVSSIKIDVEGAEYDVLVGGKNTLERDNPNLLLEWNETNLSQFGRKFSDIEFFLEEIGYKHFYSLSENRFYFKKLSIPILVAIIDHELIKKGMKLKKTSHKIWLRARAFLQTKKVWFKD